jgi:glycosyltransferase involved in cell wall biosynthesis
MAEDIKVSVLCLTYNQAAYIRQALDGFLMQKTGFEYEILVNDDCSTDGTRDILSEYAARHPNIVLNLQDENLWSQGVRGMFMRFLLPRARGEYVALCEGDDYWTDPAKLQTQADFLDQHPDHALCFHPVRIVFEGGEEAESLSPAAATGSSFTTEELLSRNFIHTNSVMYRRQTYPDRPADLMPADWYLHLYHARYGKIGFIDKPMAVYRRHPGGVWWNSYSGENDLWGEYGRFHLRFFLELLTLFGDDERYRARIELSLSTLLSKLAELDEQHGTQELAETLQGFPDDAWLFVHAQSRERKVLLERLRGYEKDLAAKDGHARELEGWLAQKDAELSAAYAGYAELEGVISSMKATRAWRLATRYRDLRDRLLRRSGPRS